VKLLKILIFVFIYNVGESQIVIEKTIDIKANEIYADKFDNLYILTDEAFLKYNLKGKKLASFYPEGGEEISSIDVRNSFKIILFFAEQNKIILLDNNLTKISNDIFLNEFDVFGDAIISGAIIGGYWIFDNVKSQLLKLSSDFTLVYKKDIKTSSRIIAITDNSTNVFLLKETGDLMSFNFNTLALENIPISTPIKNFQIENDELIFYSSNMHSLKFQNLQDNKVSSIKILFGNSISGAGFGNSKVFFFDKLKVYICSVKQK